MNKEKPKKETRSNNKGGYFIRSLSLKRQAVEEHDSGAIPVKEILKKYNIAPTTLWNWRRQVQKGVDPLIRRTRHPEELKLRIVKEIVTGLFTAKEAAKHYDIKKTTVEEWRAKYSYQISDLTEPMAKKPAKESALQSDHIRQLERALEDANLKIIGLETMINIAEKDLKIDIRKKSGTKQ
ncbi:transposase [Microcoleus sp. Aus8_D3]|uniref:transposase n=1 Tax=Microcoleus sp. Aus8_D3 TaxID=2818633 RepID=UPI002FD1A010